MESANLNRYKTRNASYYNRILVKEVSTLLPFSMIRPLTTDCPLSLYSLLKQKVELAGGHVCTLWTESSKFLRAMLSKACSTKYLRACLFGSVPVKAIRPCPSHEGAESEKVIAKRPPTNDYRSDLNGEDEVTVATSQSLRVYLKWEFV